MEPEPALYIAGYFTQIDTIPVTGVARWNGTSWSAVGSGITLGSALAVFDDGSGAHLYLGHDGPNVSRWDGTAWSPVGPVEPANGLVQSFLVQDDGSGSRLVAGGDFHHIGGVAAENIARFDGSSWSPLGAGVNGPVHALALFNDGNNIKLHAAGWFTQADGTPASNIARFDGSGWSPLGSGVTNGPIAALVVFDDGTGRQLYAGGNIFNAGGIFAHGIARWNGTSWSSVAAGVDAEVAALTVHDDGSGPALFVGGTFANAGGVPSPYLAKWRSSGWKRLGDGHGLDGRGRALLVRNESTGPALYCGGLFDTAGNVAANQIARFDGTQWSALGSGLISGGAEVYALAEYDDGSGAGKQIVAGGGFEVQNGPYYPGIAKWNGTNWVSLGAGTGNNGRVHALCVFDDGQGPELYAGGDFTQMGGVHEKCIAKWNGTSWSSVGGGTTSNPANPSVDALAVYDDGSGPALYAGGYFFAMGGPGGPSHIARWKNGAWSAVPAGVISVKALLPWNDGSGEKFYFAASIGSGTTFTVGVGALDGASFTQVGPGFGVFPNSINSLTTLDEGAGSGTRLYAGGNLGTVGGVAHCGAARFDGANWTPLGSFTSGSGNVFGLTGFDAGQGAGLFVAGSFFFVDGTPTSGIARFASNCPDPVAFCFGTASACPCGNAGAPGNGCATSFGAGANLATCGVPSIANDTLVLNGAGTSSSVLTYFQGTTRVNNGDGAVFGDGLRCAGGSVVRLAAVLASGGVSQYPNVGNPSVSVRGQVTAPGSKRTYQVWFRNAASFCTPSTFNLSNGVEVTWGP